MPLIVIYIIILTDMRCASCWSRRSFRAADRGGDPTGTYGRRREGEGDQVRRGKLALAAASRELHWIPGRELYRDLLPITFGATGGRDGRRVTPLSVTSTCAPG